MKSSEVMAQLKELGSAQTRRVFARHGAPEEMFGVKVGDLKPIAKNLKGEQALALDLYATGNADAMYLAGLVADGAQMSKKELESWVKSASWQMISEYTVPWVASESKFGRELALKWIDSNKEKIASSGWATLSAMVAIRPDDELDLKELQALLDRVRREIHAAPPRVKCTMNHFVIAVGSYVKPLHARAKAAARQIGPVDVDMGETSCKIPLATDYIAKVESKDRVGRKRTTARC